MMGSRFSFGPSVFLAQKPKSKLRKKIRSRMHQQCHQFSASERAIWVLYPSKLTQMPLDKLNSFTFIFTNIQPFAAIAHGSWVDNCTAVKDEKFAQNTKFIMSLKLFNANCSLKRVKRLIHVETKENMLYSTFCLHQKMCGNSGFSENLTGKSYFWFLQSFVEQTVHSFWNS